MKKFVIPVILLILISLQNSLFEYVRILGVKPDIVLTFIICFSLIRGNPAGLVIGIIGGVLEDIFFGFAFGINSIACMITSYIIGIIESKVYKDNIFVPAIATFLGTIIKELVVFLFLYLTKTSFDIVSVMTNIIIREAVYNTVLAAIFFRYVKKVSHTFLPDQNRRF